MIVLIDDERTFKSSATTSDYILLKTSSEALEWLSSLDSNIVIDQLWFDHDLGMVNGSKDTTIPVLAKLEEMCFLGIAPDIRSVIVHTSNLVGGNEIEKSLNRYFPVTRVFAGEYLEVCEAKIT